MLKEIYCDITTAWAKECVQRQLAELQNELAQLVSDYDKKNNADIFDLDEASAIKQKLKILRRNRIEIRTKIQNIVFNMQSAPAVSPGDIDELAYFFPAANIRELQEIERFHQKIANILQVECQEELTRLNGLLEAVNTEIAALENQCRKKRISESISSKFLHRYAELSIQINELEIQIQSYDHMQRYNEEWRTARHLLC